MGIPSVVSKGGRIHRVLQKTHGAGMAALTSHPVIASFFRLKKAIGSGSYGDVYEAVDERTRACVAVKLEPVSAKFPQLVYEHRVLEELAACHGFPRVVWFETNDVYNVMVMQKLGKSLEDVRTSRGGTLDLDTVLKIAREALDRLEACHVRGIAYRDIKTQNFLFGLVKKDGADVFLIDFGLCKRVANPVSGVHIPMRTDKKLVGTPRYASLNAHRGIEQSRRDDVESLVYLLVFLAKGRLPWQTGPDTGCSSMSALLRRVAKVKMETDVRQLCDGLPPMFANTLTYARELAFEAMPDYTLLNHMWRR